MKQTEYSEGPKSLENFKRGMIALFKVPKLTKKKQAVKPASVKEKPADKS